MTFDLFIVLFISYILIGYIVVKQLKFSYPWFGVALPFWPLVLVGKNNVQNDKLTFKIAQKN